MTKVDLHLRGIDTRSLKKIEQKLELINKGKDKKDKLSRNKYLVSIINSEASKQELDYQKTMYDQKIEALHKDLQEVIKVVNRVLYLLMTGQVAEGMNLLDDLERMDSSNDQ
ncbi:hypothetical protein [uncultured Lactobacillus sp.]|uniref:hypothetical protein n=1 Tax=uncultured Lactobacillus sp. TaxID=153152 RepID=UPI00259BB5C6|nr:hypothetical protein [uncultured Lactobacillus sp.]